MSIYITIDQDRPKDFLALLTLPTGFDGVKHFSELVRVYRETVAKVQQVQKLQQLPHAAKFKSLDLAGMLATDIRADKGAIKTYDNIGIMAANDCAAQLHEEN